MSKKLPKNLTEAGLRGALSSWTSLNNVVGELSEDQLMALLKLEQQGARRPTFLMRIYGRYNRVRALRERQALLSR